MGEPNPILDRILFLRAEVERHTRLYYDEAAPEISDAEFDLLYRELERLEAERPEFDSPDSPTHRVGGHATGEFAKVRHDPPMLSLDKTHSTGDLLAYDRFLGERLAPGSWSYVVEPKVDGLSISLLYERGRLVRAATRGDGDVGDDVTANVRTIRGLPRSIPCDAPAVEIRGEVYMDKAGFAELARQQEESGEQPFANPRNAAAGSLKLHDPAEVARRPLAIVLYGAGRLDGVSFATHREMIATFAEWGLPTPPRQWACRDMASALEAIEELRLARHSFPFEIDGAVVKIDQRDLYAGLGSTARSPHSARAFKYAPERAETTVRGITVQVGRTGVLTPVAELDPVHLAGSTIARATLHNADEIARKDIRVGDRVWIVKAGDVIPAVESAIAEKRDGSQLPFAMPDSCPVCGAPATRADGEVATRCSNPVCPARLEARLEHFASRGALDLEGLGGKVASALVAARMVSDPLDLFGIPALDFAALDIRDPAADGEDRKAIRFGETRAKKLSAALDAARTLPLNRWLVALGIPGIGETAAEQVSALAPDWNGLPESEDLRASARLPELVERAAAINPRSRAKRAEGVDSSAEFDAVCAEIDALGSALAGRGLAKRAAGNSRPAKFLCTVKPETARAMVGFFASDWGKAVCARLAELGVNPRSASFETGTDSENGPLAGATVVLTGTMSEPRDAVAVKVKAAGGKVVDSVSKNTTFVVAGDAPGASKINKAGSLGIPVISESDLLARISSQPAPEPAPSVQPVASEAVEDNLVQGELF